MLKLCDFGTARDISTSMTNCIGTAEWMAPEVIIGSKYCKKIDVYSWSIILWEILSRKRPFYEYDEYHSVTIMYAICKDVRPKLLDITLNCPEQLKCLMTLCWAEDPCKRPSMMEIVDTMTLLSNDMVPTNEPVIIPVNEKNYEHLQCKTCSKVAVYNSTNVVLNIAISQNGPLYWSNRVYPGHWVIFNVRKVQSEEWFEVETKLWAATNEFYRFEAVSAIMKKADRPARNLNGVSLSNVIRIFGSKLISIFKFGKFSNKWKFASDKILIISGGPESDAVRLYSKKNGDLVQDIEISSSRAITVEECIYYENRRHKNILEQSVYTVRGKDRGRDAWHYVFVDNEKKKDFLEKAKTRKMDVEDFGKILYSGWGDGPPKKLIDQVDRMMGPYWRQYIKNNLIQFALLNFVPTDYKVLF